MKFLSKYKFVLLLQIIVAIINCAILLYVLFILYKNLNVNRIERIDISFNTLTILGSILFAIGIGQGVGSLIKKTWIKGITKIVLSALFGYILVTIYILYILLIAGGPPVKDYESRKNNWDLK